MHDFRKPWWGAAYVPCVTNPRAFYAWGNPVARDLHVVIGRTLAGSTRAVQSCLCSPMWHVVCLQHLARASSEQSRSSVGQMDRKIQTRPPAERQSQLPKYLLSRVCTTINVNSSPHSAAYVRRWIGSALLQIMVCRLIGTKPLSGQTFRYSQELSPGPPGYRNKLQWNFNQNRKIFIHRNASEYIICEMTAILSRGG